MGVSQQSAGTLTQLHPRSFLDLKSADDVQEAYNLIRDVVPVTPQVIPKLRR